MRRRVTVRLDGRNFAALIIADTFVSIDSRWWVRTPSDDTKCPCARQVPPFVADLVDATSRRTAGVTEQHDNRADEQSCRRGIGMLAQLIGREVTVRPSAVN